MEIFESHDKYAADRRIDSCSPTVRVCLLDVGIQLFGCQKLSLADVALEPRIVKLHQMRLVGVPPEYLDFAYLAVVELMVQPVDPHVVGGLEPLAAQVADLWTTV